MAASGAGHGSARLRVRPRHDHVGSLPNCFRRDGSSASTFPKKAVERASADYSATDFGNLTFRQADVYELPFEDETFDVAFSHACLSNLQEPSRALREMWRVLRPGGVLGIRDSDDEAAVWAPVEGPMGRWYELFSELFRANGGDTRFGRKLRGLAAQIGFEK